MSDDFDIKIHEREMESTKDKKIVYEARLIYKGDNQEFIDYIKSLQTFHKLSQNYIDKLASVTITFYSDTQLEPYE